MTKPPLRAIIYTRISRDDSGLGAANERQEEECRNLAAYRGYEVIGVEADISYSASTGKLRPAWERVLSAIALGEVDVVIAWHFDRMTRSMVDLEDLINLSVDNNVSIATVTGDLDLNSDMGRMLARILAAVARGEVERKSARQRSANRQRAVAGIPWGSGFRAFGYELDGAVKPAEADAIKLAARDALNGTPMREIARRWTDAEFRSTHARGSEISWTGRGIQSLLVNPRYAGIATYRGEVVGTGNWEPIFDSETHAVLRARLTDPKRRTRTGGGRKPEHLLSSIAKCSKHAATVTAGTANGVPAYVCETGCIGTGRADADAYVLDRFEAAVRAFGPRTLFGQVLDAVPEESEQESADALLKRRAVVTAAYLRGDLPGQDFEEALAEVRGQLDALEARTQVVQPRAISVTEGADDYLAEFHASTLNARRSVIESTLSITLHPKGKGKRNVPIDQQVKVMLHLSGEAIDLNQLDNDEATK